MDVESIRRYCLSFPHTKEKLQWGETLCFKAEEKIVFSTPALFAKRSPLRYIDPRHK